VNDETVSVASASYTAPGGALDAGDTGVGVGATGWGPEESQAVTTVKTHATAIRHNGWRVWRMVNLRVHERRQPNQSGDPGRDGIVRFLS
jgi:hypothetical protein